MKNAVFTFCFTLLSVGAFAQAKTIKLDNPSFEDFTGAGHAPKGWLDCGFAGETPPDVCPTGQFRVTQDAKKGATYLGMVTRDNQTFEAVGQKLKSPLLPDTCYEFTVELMSSPIYMSQSRVTGEDVNFNKPTKLVVCGGRKLCEQMEVLAESPIIQLHDWRLFRFTIRPTKQFDFIVFTAYYPISPVVKYTNGNLLVDNLSDIKPCNCLKSEGQN